MTGLDIGFIKYYDKIKKFGFIRCLDETDVFFHITDSSEKSYKIGDIVGFVLHPSERFPSENVATEVRFAKDYTEEYRKAKDTFCEHKWGMILKGNPILFEEYVLNEIKSENITLESFDEYVESIDIDNFISLYQVKVIGGGINKPGDDDTAYVDIRSCWLPLGKWWPVPKAIENDVLLKQLLPFINIGKFHSRAFCSWGDMLSEYYADKENWIKLETEASQMELEIKQKAKETYNKEQHKNALYLKRIDTIREKCHSNFYRIAGRWQYNQIMMSAK